MNRLAFRYCFPAALLAVSASVSAIGLGELRGQPALGERLQVEVGLLGGGKDALDASCYRIVQPAGGGDLPWLKKANLTVRKGNPPVLEVRSEAPLREPILQFSIHVACGNDISRDYVILASPAREVVPVVAAERSTGVRESTSVASSAQQSGSSRPATKERPLSVPRAQAPRVRSPEKIGTENGLPDRLMLSAGIDVGEPSLRLATGLFGGMKQEAGAGSSVEAQREVLRLEYRMLMALHEQASTQMATAEKLRNMEGTLAELERRTLEVAQRVEKGAGQAESPSVKDQAVVPEGQKSGDPSGSAVKASAPSAPVPEASDDFAEWMLYSVVVAAILALGGLLGWRNYRERQVRNEDSIDLFVAPELEVDPKRDEEREELGGVDLHVEPAVMGATMKVDVELDAVGEVGAALYQAPSDGASEAQLDSVFSVNATTLDEHFEANPVMELADIMLSFGRVKGAAQALQEYIDNNPQEALQPWIRLMDVYKMAGMRNEFEAVALNLNQNFNVEIQQWDGSEPSQNRHSLDLVLDEVPAAPVPLAPRPECLEDMPRIMASVTQFWSSGDVVGYLYQLLRDNRGGKRVGFALPVVEEILFLIELKETSNRMERELEGS